MAAAVHTLSVRVDEQTFQESKRIAEQRAMSFNALVQEALRRVIEAEQEREMYEAATLLGQDAEMNDVEYARHAQAEVALGDAA